MKFLNSTNEDFDEIFRLYDLAIEFQKTKFDKSWLPFDKKLIEKEIAEKRHWKIVIDEKIACIFSIAFEDPLIWKKKTRTRRFIFTGLSRTLIFAGKNLCRKLPNGRKFMRNQSVKILCGWILGAIIKS